MIVDRRVLLTDFIMLRFSFIRFTDSLLFMLAWQILFHCLLPWLGPLQAKVFTCALKVRVIEGLKSPVVFLVRFETNLKSLVPLMILRMNRFFVAGLKSSGRGVIITFSRIPIEDKICKKNN